MKQIEEVSKLRSAYLEKIEQRKYSPDSCSVPPEFLTRIFELPTQNFVHP